MRASDILDAATGRDQSLPLSPWTMRQSWHDLLFMHWPVQPSALRRCVPAPLELDIHEGSAWIAVVPFWMSGIRLRGLPMIPGASAFPELNVRTYVRYRGRPGVYFMSLDAPHRLLSFIARRWYGLPYVHASISIKQRDGAIHFRSMRTVRLFRHVGLNVTYRPDGPVRAANDDSLSRWMLERYRLFTVGRMDRVWCAEICHAPWHIQSAAVELTDQAMTSAHGVEVPGPPVTIQYCKRMETLIWSPKRVEIDVGLIDDGRETVEQSQSARCPSLANPMDQSAGSRLLTGP